MTSFGCLDPAMPESGLMTFLFHKTIPTSVTKTLQGAPAPTCLRLFCNTIFFFPLGIY